MSYEESEEDVSRVQQMMAEALPADADTEAKLRYLQRLQDVRRKDPVIEAEYARLRDELARQIGQEGPRYYLDDHGVKRFAYIVQPEPLEYDVNELVKAKDEGRISEALLDELAPRKPNSEAIKQAAARGMKKNPRRPGLPPDVFVKVARKTKGTAYVKYSSPVDPADREQ